MTDSHDDMEFWTVKTVTTKIGKSKSWIYSQVRAGVFPEPKKYPNGKTVFWLSGDIRDWQRGVLVGGIGDLIG